MTTQNDEAHCSICKEKTNRCICRGSSKDFGFEHLTEHRESLNTQLQHVQNDYDQFRKTLNMLEQDLEKHPLFEKINQWRKESIGKIEETAKECRENLIKYLNPIINEMKMILDDPKEQPKAMKKENEFNEIDLDKFTEKLKKLKEELDQPSTISIKQKSTPCISKIYVRSEQQLLIPNLNPHHTWERYGTSRAGGNRRGDGLDQLWYPCGMFIDDDQTMYIADTSNDRIVAWRSGARNGEIVAGGHGGGDRNDQLNRPTNVLIDKEKLLAQSLRD